MSEAKSNIDIEKLTAEERAELSRGLAEFGQNLPNVETAANETKPKLEGSAGNQKESSKTDISHLTNAKTVSQTEGGVIDITKGKKGLGILNNFFETGDFESIPDIQKNAAEVMDEAMDQKKSA